MASMSKGKAVAEVPIRCSFSRLERVSALKPNPRNPNHHPDAQLDLLAKVISHQGWRRAPVVSKESGLIVTGHGAVEAAKRAGWERIPIDVQSFASPEDERAHMLADNKLAELAEIDEKELAALLSELKATDIDMDLTGFNAEALSVALSGLNDAPVDAEPQIDRATELQKEWKTKRGQVWELGEHRLMCGDSTDRSEIHSLMDGEKAQLCLTDPPYGIGEKYDSHEDTPETLKVLIQKFWPLALDISERMLLTPSTRNQWLYPIPDWTLCWFVSAGTGAGPWGFTCWQPVLAYGKDPYLQHGLGSRPDALSMTESADNKLGHPCPKPLKVWSWFLERGSIKRGEVVFEPFCGSGTTLLACENLHRRCRAMEISPAYVAVALQRFKDATGKTPKLIR